MNRHIRLVHDHEWWVVEVDDYETFDFIDDFLAEETELECVGLSKAAWGGLSWGPGAHNMKDSEYDVSDTVEYLLSREDVEAQFRKLILRPRVCMGFLFLLLVGVVGVVASGGRKLLPFGLLVFGAVMVLILLTYPRRMVNQHPEFLQTQTLEFNSRGFSVFNSAIRVSWEWARVLEVTEDSRFLRLRVDSFGSGAFFPKDALQPVQMERLREYLKEAASKSR